MDVHNATELAYRNGYAAAKKEHEKPRGRWKYYHKQNIAVCTNCSFERNLKADFGAAKACPNCGADMTWRATK